MALTAALALGSLPGLVGAREPGPEQPIDAAAFRQVILATLGQAPSGGGGASDAALVSVGSDGRLDSSTSFVEQAGAQAAVVDRAAVALPPVPAAWSWKPAKYSLTGYASFYDHGTTAMRTVPRGTTIVICGAGGCVQRIVNDYGPAAWTGRIIDMYRPDFFAICGCGSWSGTTWVTVRVY
ncbi:MAG TPA: hypothetical protein VGI98_02530 [Candidatus Limnocylindrales bacterium]